MCGFLIFLIISYSRVFYSTGVQYKIGNPNFDEIVKSPAFVDKTMMIKDFFEHRYVLLRAPRRFGKTINMDMVREFCELKVSRNGKRIPKEKTDNYKLFTKNNLNIHNPTHHSFFNKHFGEYPVIYLEFSVLDGDNFISFLESFKLMVMHQFKYHDYLLQSDCLNTDARKEEFNKFYIEKNILALNRVHMVGSINVLTNILHEHFEKKVIILIDEFDVPLQKAIFQAGNDTGKIIEFITEFIKNVFKINKFVERGLINACISLSGVLTYGANNIDVYRFADSHPFNMYNGFTEEEVLKISVKCNCTNRTREIKEWYDGYNVAETKIKLYNVWSIVNFMKYKVLERYWAEPDYVLQLRSLCTHFIIFNHFVALLTTNQTEIAVIKKMSIDHVEYLKTLIPNPEVTEVTLEDAYIFLNLMLDLGYFNAVDKYKIEKEEFYSITIPNKEIRKEIKRNLKMIDLLETTYYVPNTFRKRYMESILNLGEEKHYYIQFLNNVNMLFEMFKIPECELEFEQLISLIPYLNMHKYPIIIRYQTRTTNGKKADLLIYNINSRTGIVIEVKYSSREREGGSLEGLEQIVGQRKYYELLDEYKVKNRIFIGIYLGVKKGKNRVISVEECSLSYLFNTTDIKKAVTLKEHKQTSRSKRKKVTWTVERRKAHSEKMKESWRKRKEQQRKKQ